MSNEHSGHRVRVRERVSKEGLDNFQNYQVLEYALTFVIPYKDTNVLAHRLINKFGSFAGVLEASEDELKSVSGVGEVVAHFLTNILKIMHYYEMDKSKQVTVLDSPFKSMQYVKKLLANKLVEEMYVVCITPKNKVVAVAKISEGTNNEAPVSIRQISEYMTRSKVSNIIVAHNHPKGRANPSQDDHDFTKALVASLSMSGCHMLDHIIIGDNDYYSYRQSGLVDKYTEYAKEHFGVKVVAQPEARYEVSDD